MGGFGIMKKIIGELCTCGHRKIHHGQFAFPKWNPDTTDEDAHPRLIREPYEEQIRMKGHGACSLCVCSQFTWKEFIFEEEGRDDK